MKSIMLSAIVLICSIYTPYAQPTGLETAKPGESLTINGRKITVVEKDITPVVENVFSKRGIYEKADNPKLQQLRKQENFDQLLAGSKNEFEQMVRINEWAQKRLPKFGTPTSKDSAPLDILKAADEGNTFYCNHFACIFVGACASMGWPSRTLALRYGNHPVEGGAPEHSVAEVWSDTYKKWVLFDPLFALHFERDGIPLNAWEIRQEWFYGNRDKINFVMFKDRKVYKHTDPSVLLGQHPGFGPLYLNERSWADKLAIIGYCPGNNVMEDGGLAYSDMFISSDTLASKVSWHIRIHPEDPFKDPYFPLNQADLKFTAAPDGLKVSVSTNTPNFAKYQYRINEGKWVDGEPGIWKLKKGKNILEVRPINTFGVEGESSRVVLSQN
jgi:hypothetical protein